MRVECAALALALLTSVAAHGAEVAIKVVPTKLQLGTDPKAQILISGPEDLSELAVTVNHGTIAGLEQAAPGHFTAEYFAPGQTVPRVAIIAVVGTSKSKRVHGWVTLQLWGSAEAVLQTVPNANVSVRIGDRTYGPIRADANGMGRILVVVPPGVQSGFYGTKVLDLGLPQVALSHLVLEHAELQADRGQTLVARFYSVTEDGKPRTGVALRARVTKGTIADFKEEAAGVYSARWKVSPEIPSDAELSVWPRTDPSLITIARLRLLAGPASRVTLTAVPDLLVPGGTREITLTAKVTDARGHPTGPAPTFTATLGTLGRLESLQVGVWTAKLLAPKGFGGATSMAVRAEVPNASAAQNLTIRLQAGVAQMIRVEPERLSLVSDGAQSAALHAQLLDADGNPVEGSLDARVAIGELTVGSGDSSVGVQTTGTHYQYRPQRSMRGGATEVVVTFQGLSARVPVELRPAPSRVTFGPKVGFLSNLGNANALAAALELGFWFSEHVGVGFEGGYVFVPRDSEVTSGPLAGTRVFVRAHGVPMLATIGWRGKLGSMLPFHATASGGLVAISSTVKLKDQPAVRELSIVPSAQLTASVGYRLSGWAPFVELGVRWVGDARGNNLTGSLFSVGASVGCRFDLL